MKVGQVVDYPVDQVITRQDYATPLEGLAQTVAKTVAAAKPSVAVAKPAAPAPVEESVMTKLTDYVKQNPYVVGGAALVLAASAWWYWSRRVVSATPAMAGLGEPKWSRDMKRAMNPEKAAKYGKKPRKSRRKSRKAKK